ncbi:hypothetical protein [Microbacterium thalli]|uniref:hypothetical protein n=1 Tax=Microbacterium thalli TaxID=3027921 RepID=UPI0023661FFB|nr:hypothetical protein [Microbacterium thalli]MDD7930092.1 hypothetical protein [Microbacterium thalli]
MRILTVRQPWAWAIIHGGKDIENRTRNIAGGYRGPVAIHVGLAYAHGWQSDALAREMNRSGAAHEDPQPWHANAGHIIGVVDLVDVHHESAGSCGDSAGMCSDWGEPGAHHLVLANPRAIVGDPIPWLGGLGLRRSRLDVYGDSIIERAEGCTCGAGRISYQHEPMCGFELVSHLTAVAR